MAKGKPPSFQFYPDAWLSSTDVMLMSPAEEGGYFRLLCHAWMAPDCGLPDDDEQLSVLSRLGSQWKRSGPRIRRKFDKIGDRLFNGRLCEERVKQDEWRKKSSEGGTKAQANRKGGSRVVDEWLPNGTQPKPKPREEEEEEEVLRELPTVKTEPPPPLACQSEYPLTTAELRRRDPAADEFFTLRLVQQVTQHLLSDGKFPPAQLDAATTDRAITAACRESYDTGPPGHRLGLLLSRVPKILVTWGIESETEKHGQTR